MPHPYAESLLPQAINTLGKAFDFADKHLPGGMERFFDLFMVSSTAHTFDGPDAQPAVGISGIELVLSVCDSSQDAGLDMMLMSSRRLPRDRRDRARLVRRGPCLPSMGDGPHLPRNLDVPLRHRSCHALRKLPRRLPTRRLRSHRKESRPHLLAHTFEDASCCGRIHPSCTRKLVRRLATLDSAVRAA